jgi:hypothetical protein
MRHRVKSGPEIPFDFAPQKRILLTFWLIFRHFFPSFYFDKAEIRSYLSNIRKHAPQYHMVGPIFAVPDSCGFGAEEFNGVSSA